MNQQTIYKKLQTLSSAIRVSEGYGYIPSSIECDENGEEFNDALSAYEGQTHEELIEELLSFIDDILD